MKSLALLTFVFYVYTSVAWAITATEIAQKTFDRDDGQTASTKVEMILIDSGGNERVRKFDSHTKDFGALAKRYIRFTSPATIDGTAFLSVEQEDDRDEQFLYLPSLGRVRRIAANQNDSSFVNSEFTYEDMQRRKVSRDNHSLIGEEELLGRSCWVIESIPKNESDSQYGKYVSWTAKDIFVPLKIDLYNKKGQLVKQFVAHKFDQIDSIWTITDSEMRNLEKKRSTRLRTLGVQYNIDISDNTFTTQYMQLRR